MVRVAAGVTQPALVFALATNVAGTVLSRRALVVGVTQTLGQPIISNLAKFCGRTTSGIAYSRPVLEDGNETRQLIDGGVEFRDGSFALGIFVGKRIESPLALVPASSLFRR